MSNAPRYRQQLIAPGGLSQRLRAARGTMQMTDLAQRAGWQISKVSKIEHGTQLPTVKPDENIDDLATWAQLTGTDATELQQWRVLLAEAEQARHDYAAQTRSGHRKLQQQFNDILEAARVYRFFETTSVPRFLQLPEYTRAVLTESRHRHLGADDVDEATAVRQASRALLDDPQRRFDMLITESVLGHCPMYLPRQVHLEQLQHLLTMAENGPAQLRFGIVPLFQRITWVPQNSFGIIDDFGYMEHWIGETHFLLTEDLQRLHRVTDTLWETACQGEQAAALIRAAIARREQLED